MFLFVFANFDTFDFTCLERHQKLLVIPMRRASVAVVLFKLLLDFPLQIKRNIGDYQFTPKDLPHFSRHPGVFIVFKVSPKVINNGLSFVFSCSHTMRQEPAIEIHLNGGRARLLR